MNGAKSIALVASVSFIAGILGFYMISSSDLPGRVADHETRITKISADSAENRENLVQHQERLEKHGDTLVKHDDKIVELEKKVVAVTADLQAAESRLGEVEAGAKTAEGEREALKLQIAEQQKDLKSLLQDYELRVAEIQKIEAKTSEQERRNADFEARLRALEKGAGIESVSP